MKYQLKAFVERTNGKMLAIASDETQDRSGDVLRAKDWDLTNFVKNPVLQFAHDYYSPPVGIAKNVRRDGTRLMFEPVFHDITQTAREVKKMYEEGIMNAFSVGFIAHSAGEGKMSLELLEISAVPVPANPSAIMIEKSIKDMTDDDKHKAEEWVIKQSEQTVSEELTEDQKRIKKYEKYQQVDQIMYAFYKVYFDKEIPVENFGTLLKETTDLLLKLIETNKIEAGANVKDFSGSMRDIFEAEAKAGRVLSKKNRTTIESAMTALQEVLDADNTQDEGKAMAPPASTEPLVLKVQTEQQPKATNTKGRNQELVLKKTLEAIASQVGYIARKVSTNN